MLAAREGSKASIAFGAVLCVLGIFAVMAPLFSGIAVTVLVGMLLMMGGVFEVIFAFKAGSWGKGILVFLFGGLGVVAGAITLMTPMRSLGALTIVLVAFFVAGGVMDIVLAFKARPGQGWGWMLFSGIVSVVLGGLIMAQWPLSGVWAVGVLVGMRVLVHGWMLMALGRTGQEALTYVQDTRIEMLERHMRAGAEALQQTQAALADHTAMLLAFDNELRKKVSAGEIDPSIRELNQKLKQARAHMETVRSATQEAWDKDQQESNVVFAELQKNAAEISRRLKQDLGLVEN
jgi:uncharacterized membrane protein HdeD (DUF308 family)